MYPKMSLNYSRIIYYSATKKELNMNLRYDFLLSKTFRHFAAVLRSMISIVFFLNRECLQYCKIGNQNFVIGIMKS